MQTLMPSAAVDGPLLEASSLAGSRGDRRLFQHLAISLHAGQVMWLRGRNGRGKTTLLRLLAGLSTPAQGDIRVLGQSLKGAPVALRSSVGYLAHANALKDDLTAAEALSFVGALAGYTPSPAEVVDALKRLGIASRAGAPVRTLSQGQRRRVALARLALPRGPRVWLLDEPFDALDDRGVEVLNGLLADHAASGGAVLLTSHQALSLRHPEPQVLNLDDYSVLA
jgi:heme exporter protein A